MIKSAIFDFDGTIADTIQNSVNFLNSIAPKYNLPILTDTEVQRLRDYSAKELLKMYPLAPWKLLPIIKDVRSLLRARIEYVPLFDGMRQVFAKLKEEGVEIGIVTGNSKENVELFLKKKGINSISFIHSENKIFGKGKVLKHLIRKQKLDKDEAFYIGDEVRDVDAAREAGIRIVSVTWGYNSEKRLRGSDPDFLVKKPEEILKCLGI